MTEALRDSQKPCFIATKRESSQKASEAFTHHDWSESCGISSIASAFPARLYVQQHYIDRDDRQRQYGAGRSKSTLVHMEDKRLFILYYVKVYPLQEILAFAFGMVQSTANEWIQLLSEILKKALDHGGYLPERDPKQLETVLASETESTYGLDGTERPRQRPRDPEKQKHYAQFIAVCRRSKMVAMGPRRPR